jgi:hypothetical protein
MSSWYKGRLLQANDGNWIFRSSSSDGSIVGFALAQVTSDWTSGETPSSGITVRFPIYTDLSVGNPPQTVRISFTWVLLKQQIPTELTN